MIDLSSTASVLYFAYGGNMNFEQISARCAKPQFVSVARLPGHEIAFYGHSERWDGGEETLRAMPGCDLYGVVYELSPSAFDRLDAWQGVKLDGTGGYFHRPAEVIGLDGARYSTLLYKKSEMREPSLPSSGYLAHILAGAQAHGLPEDYLSSLRALSSHQAGYPVPKPERTDRFLMTGGGGCGC
ncbi:MAG TPA: gamma-glutamylcyclotransferase family protein [Candidatus Sulfotelmatobacter sp.]|jgi:hypothetical protein|nr:gamma-glutamylcyclotransferase family protein [Candidatus Sulfotelmatobacter sp.]